MAAGVVQATVFPDACVRPNTDVDGGGTAERNDA